MSSRDTKNCPIRQRTADGVSVGRCWHYTGESNICPLHGDVRLAIEHFNKTQKLTDERDHKTKWLSCVGKKKP